SALVSFFSAKAMGHMEPSSSFALSLKPNIAYRSLNFVALRKKQTSLTSLFAYAGIPYQVFGERSGALSLPSACSRFPIARSCGAIAASAARTAFSPSSAAFSSFARALIAAFSSAVNPWFFCCLRFFAVVLIVLLRPFDDLGEAVEPLQPRAYALEGAGHYLGWTPSLPGSSRRRPLGTTAPAIPRSARSTRATPSAPA